MHTSASIARALSEAFLADALDVEGLVSRGSRLFGKRYRWLRPLAARVCTAFSDGSRPRQSDIVEFLLRDAGFREALEKHEPRLAERRIAPGMMPAAAARDWDVPAIGTPGQLADWLQIGVSDLDWFADRKNLQQQTGEERLRHYRYRVLSKRPGQARLIEAPKPRLKALQRRVLYDLLAAIPLHPAAHGFRSGHSIKTFAEPHAGRQTVLRLDLQNFFPSISLGRVQAVFRTVGYPERVADLLGGLCTSAAPAETWDDDANFLTPPQLRALKQLYGRRHLPQGAPTSPTLANLCAYRLDCRLMALAEAAGARYTRYADDLAFSGDAFSMAVQRFQLHVCAIAIEEGFAVQHHKTRVMRQGVCQRLAGIVVNQRPNIIRADYDRLKATLTNCLRHGAESQNRTQISDYRGHLLGRISFVTMVNPARGQRLREIFERIEW